MNLIYVFLGAFAWIVLHFANAKDSFDKENKKFNIPKYFNQNWDNAIYSIIGGYIVYFAFPFLWQAWFHYKKEQAPDLWEAYAPLCGFFGGLILQQIYRLITKFSK